MNAVKARLAFATRRWGGSGALFAWDLWNEIHPGQAEESAEPFPAFIQELSDHLRRLERGIHGRAHPQTVSLFGPEMKWRPHLPFADTILRHPALDFANLHVYEEGTIDDPANTVDPAVAMGRLVAENIGDTPKGRPFFELRAWTHPQLQGQADHAARALRRRLSPPCSMGPSRGRRRRRRHASAQPASPSPDTGNAGRPAQ